MFKQLILKNVPSILIRILCFWCRSQDLCILWGNTRSSFLLFQMVFAKVEYFLLNYSLFIRTISLSWFFLRRRFILHKETNLQKKLHTYFTKSIYTYNGDAIHNIHAGSLRTTSYRSL